MKCYNHNDRDAIGICYACHRAVCSECADLVDNTLCCKTTCNERVKDVLQVLNTSIQNVKYEKSRSSKNRQDSALWALILGSGAAFFLYKYISNLVAGINEISILVATVVLGMLTFLAISKYRAYSRIIENEDK